MADISSLLAHNSTANLANSTVSGATLQLNSVLVVNEKSGTQQVYWAQDTPDFVTSASQIAYSDNLWNYSVSGFLSNGTVASSNGGYVISYSQAGLTQYYYGLELLQLVVRLPPRPRSRNQRDGRTRTWSRRSDGSASPQERL